MADLLIDGAIDVYPSAAGKGFFDIDYRAGKLVLTAKNHVGLIPINDRVAIHVIPRFPVENLLYILGKADPVLRYVTGFARTYLISTDSVGNPERLFGEMMLRRLREMRQRGILRRYIATTEAGGLRGNILLGPTVSRYIARGIRYKHVRRVVSLAADLPENRVVKRALIKLAEYYSRGSSKEQKLYARHSEQLLMLFDSVSDSTAEPGLGVNLPKYVRALPMAHGEYASLLWLAYLIESKKGVELERLGGATFDTFVVNLAELFESYLRNLIREHVAHVFPGCFVEDGNKRPVRLFAQGQSNPVKPDIYVTRGGVTVALLDAKYKPRIKEEDRYELLAFCDALRIKKALLVSPGNASDSGVTVLGTTQSGVELLHAKIDLSSRDMMRAETDFVRVVSAVFSGQLGPR
jgi:5-methylcytosine-specific restriction enzyme subunit McrC